MKSNALKATELLSWKDVLAADKQQEYFKQITNFVERERASGKIIYPANSEVFNALSLTPLANVRVVILGQDPYHGAGQAHGLAFSVKPGVPFPPSLQNIFKELKSDLGIEPPPHGCLTKWAQQGVLLLNTSLTVQSNKPLSHSQIGWERFTDTVIRQVSEQRSGIVFLLWGSFAQKKAALIDSKKHHVLSAPHPSPLSAYRGFFGSKHFSLTNQILRQQGEAEIDWQLDPL
jgi:uracil-DNA glycosylase